MATQYGNARLLWAEIAAAKTDSSSRAIPLHRAERSVKVDARTLLSRKREKYTRERESTRARAVTLPLSLPHTHTRAYTLSVSLPPSAGRFVRSLSFSFSSQHDSFGVACGVGRAIRQRRTALAREYPSESVLRVPREFCGPTSNLSVTPDDLSN